MADSTRRRPRRQPTTVAIPLGIRPIGPHANLQARLLAAVFERTASNEEYQRGYWIPFGKKEAVRLLASPGPRVLRECVRLGYLERHGSYLAGGFSKAVRLPDRYRDGKFRLHPLTKSNNRNKPEKYLLDPVSLWLRSRMDAFSVGKINSHIESAWHYFSLLRIHTRDFFCMRDSFGNRFHSAFTGLPSYLRHFLSCALTVPHCREGQRGEPPPLLSAHSSSFFSSGKDTELIEIDVKTCQPLILGAEIKKTAPNEIDVDRWLDICSRGDIYQYVADAIGSNRKAIKKQMMRVNFGTIEYAQTMPAYHVMKNDFPAFLAHIEKLKTQDPKGHRHVAQVAQRTESRIMIDGVCGELMRRCPDLPILTIHDAVIVPRWAVDMVSEVIRATWRRELGVVPRLTTTSLGSPVAA